MSAYKQSKDSSFSKLTIKLGSDTIKLDMYQELKISEESLDPALQKQPVNYGFVAMVYQRVTEAVKLYKLELEGFYSELYSKQEDKVINGKYQTKEAKENKVKTNPKYRIMQQKLIRLETQKGILEDFKRALEQKKDIMQTLSANRRKEFNQ